MIRFIYLLLLIGVIQTHANDKDEYTIYFPSYGEWSDVGSPFGCTDWSPDPSRYNTDEKFIQTATDCYQKQERSVQNRKQNIVTDEVVNDGPLTFESHNTSKISTREIFGTNKNLHK